MIKAVGITISELDKTYYVSTNELEINKNVTVIVEIENDLFFCKVVTDIEEIEESKISGKVLRISTKRDYQNYQKDIEDGANALKDAKNLAEKYDLKMKVVDASFTFDRNQLLIHFYSEERIDFRALAKDLASIYKTRIELRQIGVRDKAKKVGGYGCCGEKLCCARFLNDFDSVSISMAKNQNISLNPNKINGVCGRLLCCLKYENENYKECRKCTPNLGQIVKTSQGEGRVIDVDLLNKKYKVDIPNVGIIEESSCNGSN